MFLSRHLVSDRYICIFRVTDVFILLLPPRCPEWNPIELVWNILTQRLHSCDLELAKAKYGSNASANMAVDILNAIGHEYTEKCFIKCYNFLVNKQYR
jgi:hypothetical protein